MNTTDELLQRLNPNQREGVITTKGPMLLLSGAGSGKTLVITKKIAYLIQEQGVYPESIFAVTFTNKAANEMKARVSDMLPDVHPYRLWVRTFHATGLRILKEYAEHLEYDRNFVVLDTQDKEAIIKNIIKNGTYAIPKHVKPKQIARTISEAKNNLLTPEGYRALVKKYNNSVSFRIADIYEEYAMFTKNENAMDFDDLIFNTITLFKTHPDILATYRATWEYMLVDEFQDTNHSQYTLIRLLADDASNLTVVGDDDQSIYAFRGATVENILSFPNDFPSAKVIKLEQNYRCPESVVACALSLIKHNRRRHEKTVFSDKQNTHAIEVWEFESDNKEAAYIVSDVERLFDERFNAKDIAILFRTNAQSRVFEKELVGHGIPYQVVGAYKFYERKEVKDMMAYLRLITNPNENISFRRIVNVPKRGLGDKSVDVLEALAREKGVSLFAALAHVNDLAISTRAKNGFAQLRDTITRYREELIADNEPHVLLENLVQELNYYKEFPEEWRRLDAKENIRQLEHAIQDFINTNKGANLADFLDDVQLYTDKENNEEDAVTLMTVHNAKGLEYPVVFLVGLEQGTFPHYFSMDSDDGLEEERRLCYVGITRAKERLCLSYAKRKRIMQTYTDTKPSLFLEELPGDRITFRDMENYGGNAYDVDDEAFSY